MKKLLSCISCLCAIFLLLPIAVLFSSCGTPVVTFNVYSLKNRIGTNTSILNTSFTRYCRDELGIRAEIEITEFSTGEELYNTVSQDKNECDVILTSDHYIERMISEGSLYIPDKAKISNYEFAVANEMRVLPFDTGNIYSIPYSFGRYGIVYDANKVTETIDSLSWEIMWNEQYVKNIAQTDDARLLFAIACLKLGININTVSQDDLSTALEALSVQKPLLKTDGYTSAGMATLMSYGAASIGVCTASEYLLMKDIQSNNVDLRFFIPENTVSYVEALCIPEKSKYKELSEVYINFLLDTSNCALNFSHTMLAYCNSLIVSNTAFIEEFGQEHFDLLYPEDFWEYYSVTALKELPTETRAWINEAFKQLSS